MNIILAPEPAPWLHQLPSLLGPECRGEVLAPWSLPALPARWVPAPQRLRSAWERRTLPLPEGLRVWGLPGWMAVEAAMRRVGRSAAAGFRARFALRRRVAQALAPLLPSGVETVLAPSLCAREVFSLARARGARCVLVEDVPSLRVLHADLDEAALHHPEEGFLRNHRASAEDVARQEAERLLADEIWVRGHFLREQLMAVGHPPERLRELHSAPDGLSTKQSSREQKAEPGHRVALLAGPALARGGLREALAALDARPGWTLWVRPIEGTDSKHLKHPRVRQVTAREQRTLQGVDVVLAPSWCESYPLELSRAVARGIPVIATDRAAGFLHCQRIPRGDVPALVAELDALSAP